MNKSSISRYRILKKLGAGGMGEVYLAEDTKLGRKVALKSLPADAIPDDQARKRLIREAQAAAKLNHPNICAIYEVDQEDRRSFIVMQYVEGETLATLIQRKALELDQALDIARQVADALSEAHLRGIIHRDIKPQNIMIASRGHVKVLDFGLSKVVRERSLIESSADTESLLSAPGMVMGTAPYMSPEQVRGDRIDVRSDIFSFGSLLYEMVAGCRPFAGENAAATLSAILTREPPPPVAPTELQRIINKCLAKDRARRYQSARDLFIDLGNLKQQLDSGGAIEPATRSASQGRRRSKTIASLAVLPLANTGDDPNAEYLSDGITESIINNLSQLPKLRVMSRSAVFRYKGSAPDPQRAGSELGVRAVLIGHVRQLGDHLIVGVELVDVADGTQLWGEQYQRRLADIFTLQEEISTEIIGKLRLRLSGEDRSRLSKRHTENAEAYQLYLKGRYFWNQRSAEGLHKGIDFFGQAIHLDPVYALAYSGLADCYTKLGDVGVTAITPREAFARARAAALRALEIDNSLAEVYASIGHLDMHHLQWADAERDFKRAIEVNPNYATAHQWYAYYMAFHRRFDEALEKIAVACKLEPLSLAIADSVGEFLYFARRNAEAIEQSQKTLEMDPNFLASRLNLGRAFEQEKMFEEAERQFLKARQTAGESIDALAALGHTYAVSGNTGAAVEVLAQLNVLSNERYVSPYEIALIHAALGEIDEAFRWLDKAYDECVEWIIYTNVDPRLDPLRSDPRFRDLLRRLGFALNNQDGIADRR
jgi:serine/threonine protein kinase/tetratricopeptide (TPR) repeat protein